MRLRNALLLASMVPVVGSACEVVSIRPNLEHCTYNEGDRYCADLDPSRPYCSQGDDECKLGGFTGCVADVTPECHAPCGTRPEGECMMGSSSGTDTGMGSESGSGSDSESGSDSTTTGPMPCVDHDDCPDAAAAFCEPTSGECVRCDGTAAPDTACAELDSTAPLCAGGACVECTLENPVVCDAQLLLCDGETNACAPCTEHGQCGSGACELAVGRCFPEDFVVTVDGDAGAMADYTSVAAAVAAVDIGQYGVIVVHELDMAAPYLGEALVDGGKTLALLAASGELPIIQGTGMNPGLRIEGAGTILYMDGVQVSGANEPGVVMDEAFAWVDRSRIIANAGGGVLAQNAAELTLRSSFIGGASPDVDAIVLNGSTLDMLYTTVGGGSVIVGQTRALFCENAATADVRNSILLSLDLMPEVVCPGLTLTNSASEAEVDFDATWFNGYAAGDFSLSATGLRIFANIAQWQTGDPITDIDGDLRPTIDRTLDYAGADIPAR